MKSINKDIALRCFFSVFFCRLQSCCDSFRPREDKGDREGIPNIHPIPQVIRLELFLRHTDSKGDYRQQPTTLRECVPRGWPTLRTTRPSRIDAEKNWRKTPGAILLFVLSTKMTKERFLLKRCQQNGNLKRIALPLLYRANSTAGKSLTRWIFSQDHL